MEHLLMRYRVRPEQLAHHLELLKEVYAELEAVDPGGFVWISYQLDDPHEFIEIAAAPELPGPLPQMESFRRYRLGLENRCESRSSEYLHPATSYGFPGE
ncbi:MAG: hypothetical protein ACRDQ7_25300 [Haloechinothrix sp.]